MRWPTPSRWPAWNVPRVRRRRRRPHPLLNSRGVVAVSGKQREVSAADVERALDAARAINLPQDREIIHVLPQTFVVDDQDGIASPSACPACGWRSRCTSSPPRSPPSQNVVRASTAPASGAGHRARAARLRRGGALHDEKELGVALIDIGGGTTDVALFRDGAVWHTAVSRSAATTSPTTSRWGCARRWRDAEELKKRYGCALTSLVPAEDETVDVPIVGGRKARQLSRQVLSEIIQPRVEEIFTLVRARADAGRAPGRGRRRRRGDGRHLDHGGRARAGRGRSSIMPVRRGVPARHRRAGRRGAAARSTPPRWASRSTAPAGRPAWARRWIPTTRRSWRASADGCARGSAKSSDDMKASSGGEGRVEGTTADAAVGTRLGRRNRHAPRRRRRDATARQGGGLMEKDRDGGRCSSSSRCPRRPRSRSSA